MSREVLTTESRSLKRSALQLRYRGIQFISAGDLKPDNPKILKHIEETQPLVTETELPLVEKVQSTPEVQNSKPSNICDTIPLPPDSYQEEGRNGEEDEDRDEEEDEDEDEDEVVFKGRHFDRPDDLPGLPPGFKDRLVVVPNTLESRDEGISVTSDDSLATSARRRCTEFSEYSQHSLNKSTRTVCTELDDVDVSDAVVADYLAHIEDDMTDHESSVLDTGDYGAHADMEEHNGEQVHNRGHRTKNSKANSFQHFLDLDDDFLAVLDGTDMTSKVGSEAEVSEDLIRRRRHTTKLLSPTLAFDVDSYGDFDIMDFDRPSLKKSKKRDQVPSFGLSDSDLEWELESSWKNDRKKKKKLKKEREELRAQGLLGGKGKVNLKAKYSEGMNVEAIKSEIRGFLLSPAREYDPHTV